MHFVTLSGFYTCVIRRTFILEYSHIFIIYLECSKCFENIFGEHRMYEAGLTMLYILNRGLQLSKFK